MAKKPMAKKRPKTTKQRQIRNSKIRSIKFKVKILKNVEGVAILDIEFEQKAQTETQLIFEVF